MSTSDAIELHSKVADEFDSMYQHSSLFKERYGLWTRTIEKYSDPKYRVLDIGCGSGVFSLYLAKKNGEVVGIDGSREMIKICETKKRQAGLKNVEFVEADINNIKKLSIEKADLIICSSVLEYLDDIDKTLGDISSLLKDCGVFIVSVPNRMSIYRRLEPLSFKITGYPEYFACVKSVVTQNEMSEKIEKQGFDLLESAYYAATPILSMLFRPVGLAKYSENLILFVARK
jgi:ubiquinone/menaquinone biosynthesis C-methylase UbiE